jgi:hemoglobin
MKEDAIMNWALPTVTKLATGFGLALAVAFAPCVAGRATAQGAGASAAPQPPAAAAPAPPPSLYKRLGGYDAIAAAADDFIARLLRDPSLAGFFAGHSDSAKARIRQLIVEQICTATGGPCVYIGRDMRTTHKGLGITEAHWTAAVGHLIASLNKLEVAHKEKQELLAIVSRLKKDIVEKP